MRKPRRSSSMDSAMDDGWHASRTVFWSAGFVAGTALFGMIAVLVVLGITAGLDAAMLESLRAADDLADALGPAWFEDTVRSLTVLGGYPVIVFAVFNVLVVLVLLRDRISAVVVFVSVSGASALSSGLKQIFARPRPDIVAHLDPTIVAVSFPSSHATVSLATWLTLALVMVRRVSTPAVRVYLVVASILLAILVGLSRIYLGVHWPSDILAGWALGFSWICVVFGLADGIGPRWQRMPAQSRGGAG